MPKVKARKRPKVKGRTRTSSLPSNFISTFGKEALIKANDDTRAFAKEVAKDAKAIIRQQKYKWEPLSEEYLERKKKLGLDERILIATKAYVNKGIGSFERKGLIFVGPKPGKHKPSGLTYQKLARIHEYGTWSIPARPLWRPLLSAALRRSKKFRREYNSAVRRAFNEKAKRATKVRKRKL